MIADMISNKSLDSIVTESFIRGRKLNISLIFITQLYFFNVAKDSSDISTKDFINIYRQRTAEPYSFLVNDATLASHNPLRFRKIIFKYNKNHDN